MILKQYSIGILIFFVFCFSISIRANEEEAGVEVDSQVDIRTPSTTDEELRNSKVKRKRKKKSFTESQDNVENQPLFRQRSASPIEKEKTPSSSHSQKTFGNSKLSTAHDQFTRDRGSIGITNFFQLGYTNSIYRQKDDRYPVRRADFILAPFYETTCFSLYCIYAFRITGLFDLTNNGKNELSLFQLTLRFPGELWGGYFAPEYGLRLFLPATPDEINKDKMTFGFGAAFALATTPYLLGTDFYKISVGFGYRKDAFNAPLESQRDWLLRSGIGIDLLLTKSIFAGFGFAYIYGLFYDQTYLETKEFIQSLRWRVNSWLDLALTHNNTEPINTTENNSRNYDLVSIKTSNISAAFSITNTF